MRNRSPLFLHLLFLCTSIAAPTEPKENATAAVELKCRDITSSTPGPDPTCWNTLKIDEWLQRWIIGPQACAQYEPWGNCFMRLTNNGVGGIDCLNIYDTKGCYPPAVGNIVPGAEIWYTAWSIWCKNPLPYFRTFSPYQRDLAGKLRNHGVPSLESLPRQSRHLGLQPPTRRLLRKRPPRRQFSELGRYALDQRHWPSPIG